MSSKSTFKNIKQKQNRKTKKNRTSLPNEHNPDIFVTVLCDVDKNIIKNFKDLENDVNNLFNGKDIDPKKAYHIKQKNGKSSSLFKQTHTRNTIGVVLNLSYIEKKIGYEIDIVKEIYQILDKKIKHSTIKDLSNLDSTIKDLSNLG